MFACRSYSSIDNLAPVVKDLLVLGKFSRQIVIKKLDSIDMPRQIWARVPPKYFKNFAGIGGTPT